MREIKFRLRDNNNKIVGYEIWHEGSDSHEDADWLHSTDNIHYYAQTIEHKYKDQYTGLKDKNGKDIYE